ncbi:M4 family metallopeptidase [Psychromonas aquimarina]|uniref:M4 family metallopeptidase n=1 Tax=Psychromonas aquimarina TaxID=444919 RepID=UPI00040AD52C|nr:M4 family metallopeptidase [Psychromonas aquimarina]
MQYRLKYLSVVIGLTCAATMFNANAAGDVDLSMTNNVQEFQSATSVRTLKNILSNDDSFALTGNENFVVTDYWVDELGKSHTRFDQLIDGIKVYGTSITVHENRSDGNTLMAGTASSNVYFISGAVAENKTENISSFTAEIAYDPQASLAAAEVIGDVVSEPELAYVYLPLSKETKLAYRIEVKYYSTAGLSHDVIFFDVNSAELLTRDALVFHSKQLKTYLMHNKEYSDSSRPGTLECSTGQTCNDASAQRAHSGASEVYDFYKEKLGRNGIDNRDMTMISSVHTGSRWNNAVWYMNQMFYGDGDGSQFTDFTKSFDIIAHELTHGVTQNTANLAYKNASGALNEAWSDIMGAAAEAYHRNSLQPNWAIGAGSYTPNKPGDALRYMNNPTKDGYSTDYYPERIAFTNNPTQQNDRGGVHGNSGIANLAFTLVVDGGTHPRNKTTITVEKLGLEKAQKIFYRALTTYFNASTDFFQAKSGTAQAALDLYGEDAKKSVEAAWCAVGVGECAGTTPTPDKELENGVAVNGLQASTGSDIVYTMQVPANAQNIKFAINGGTGDADLYVKYGALPTDQTSDCSPLKNGNAETCSMTQDNGTYYVRVKAYASFANVSLTGSYTTETTPVPEGAWDAGKIYLAGDIVTYNGKTYRALWWTQGQEPGTEQWGPWKLLD